MSLSQSDIQHLAKLSKMALNDEQVQKLEQELNHIFAMVDIINNTDTDNVAPLASPLECEPHYRLDINHNVDLSDELMHIAPKAEDNLYLVPNAIEENT